MNDNQVSFTALVCAYLRACHARDDEPKIFNDFLAYQLIPAEKKALIEQRLLKRLQNKNPEYASSFPDQETAIRCVARALNNRNTLLSRSRYAEDALDLSLATGIRQYVILGAGFDTFAFRRAETLGDLQVFEVDHPSTQEFKKSRIAELGWKVPAQLQFVPMDFIKDQLKTALRQSTYDCRIKGFFSWLGVTMYLDHDEVFATLRSIVEIAPAGSVVVFNYLDMEAFDTLNEDSRMKELMAMTQHVGEPMKTGFFPGDMPANLKKSGLRLLEDLNADAIKQRYSQGNRFAHFVQAKVE